MRPNYEEPLDTAKQLAEKKITLYDGPGFELWKEFLLESSNADYNKLGETYIITDHWDNFYNMIEHNVIGAGTHALMTYSLAPYELAMGRWHRSKDKVAGQHPYGGYLTSKKWHFNEESRCSVRNNKLTPLIWIFQEMAKHLQYFQQVNCN